MQGHPPRPGPVPVDPPRGGPQMPVGHGDDAGIPPLERGDHFGEPEDGGLPTGTALPVEAGDGSADPPPSRACEGEGAGAPDAPVPPGAPPARPEGAGGGVPGRGVLPVRSASGRPAAMSLSAIGVRITTGGMGRDQGMLIRMRVVSVVSVFGSSGRGVDGFRGLVRARRRRILAGSVRRRTRWVRGSAAPLRPGGRTVSFTTQSRFSRLAPPPVLPPCRRPGDGSARAPPYWPPPSDTPRPGGNLHLGITPVGGIPGADFSTSDDRTGHYGPSSCGTLEVVAHITATAVPPSMKSTRPSSSPNT
ncbi:hypothetical protein SMICM304S_10670 [Streptomyces microflavus]